jgi:hypothetical protein
MLWVQLWFFALLLFNQYIVVELAVNGRYPYGLEPWIPTILQSALAAVVVLFFCHVVVP